jgi:hypothetical protein
MIWPDFKIWCDNKKVNLQYKEEPLKYTIFGWDGPQYNECIIYKTDQVSVGTDTEKNLFWLSEFEANYKSLANKPYEFRSTDGLLKYASAKFVEALDFYVDGEHGSATITANTIAYLKTHYIVPFTLSGVDVNWADANHGDYLDFEVGLYTDINDESTFQQLNQFGHKYHIRGTGSRLFDVPTVKVVPSTVTIGPYTFDIYIRTTYANVGTNDVKLNVNLIGWK